jgi:Zn-dependent peptidase ImmA (M78 family)
MNELFSKRLVSARKLSGLSLRELSDRLSIGLSASAISLYEKGKRRPDSSIVIALSRALDVPVDYFFRDSKVELSSVEFRKRSKLGKKRIEQIKEQVIDYLSRYIEIEEILNIKNNFVNPLNDYTIHSDKDVVSSALKLRIEWELGLNPIPNIIEMLEDKGIKIVEIDVEKEFDGLASWVGDVPVIVLNLSYDNIRKRFTVLHELAHLLLRFDGTIDSKSIEKHCHSFAGTFLIPDQSLKSIFKTGRKHFSIDELIEIKEYYGISVQALVYRLYNLNYISENTLKTFFIDLNKHQLRDEKDWGNYLGKESSSRFERLVLMAVSEEIISLSKAAQLLNRDLEDIKKK